MQLSRLVSSCCSLLLGRFATLHWFSGFAVAQPTMQACEFFVASRHDFPTGSSSQIFQTLSLDSSRLELPCLLGLRFVGSFTESMREFVHDMPPNQGPLERTTFDRSPVSGTGLVLSSLLHLGVRSPFGRRSRNAALMLSDARRQPNN